VKGYCLPAGGALFFIFLAHLFPPCLNAQETAPRTERQIVFGISPFDGTKYLSSFLPESREELLITADMDHALTVLLSDVYYWPITAEYLADFQGVHIPLAGKLSVFRGRELIRELEARDYIYVYPQGTAGEAEELLYGEEMFRFMREVEDSMPERAANPNKTWAAFQGPFRGFVLNLPKGQYRLVFSVENQDRSFSMEKRLRVFSPVGRGMVYQIIPGEKWTVSSASETPQQRIYLKPGTIIYLKIFPTILYNRAEYDLMASPHRPAAGIGLRGSSIWIHHDSSLEDDAGASLRMEAAGRSVLIEPEEFLVRQIEGSALGYVIVDYDPEQFPGSRPTFTAYRLSAPPPGMSVKFGVPGMEKESVRYLRSLEPRTLHIPLAVLFLPLVLPVLRIIMDMAARRRIRSMGGFSGSGRL
jgi:hypothetical protein